MPNLLRMISTLSFCAIVAACGGGSSSGTGSNTSSQSTKVLAAGTTFTLMTNTSVLAPSGTTVSSNGNKTILIGAGTSNSGVTTLNGTGNTVITQAGAVVNVPVNATGPANNLVTTYQTASGGDSNPALKVSILAGSPTSNLTGSTPVDGTGTSATFWGGGHMAVDASGNIIVSDYGALKKTTQAGVVTTLSPGFQPFDWEGIAIDSAGNVYGSGSSGSLVSTTPPTWGASISKLSALGAPQNLFTNWETSTSNSAIGSGGLALDSSGNLFLADGANNRIVKFTQNGTWSVLAGNGNRGNADGAGTSATFILDSFAGLVIDTNNNLYVNSAGSIRKIAPDGAVTTVVSNLPTITNAIALDQAGNLYVSGYQTIYRVSSSGSVVSFDFPNTVDLITAMTTDTSGNLYVATRGIGAQIFKISFGNTSQGEATIGGTITGLPAGVIVLLVNNGSDTIHVDGSGNFTFDKKLPAGSAYNVTLFTQSTGASCSVVNGAGTVDQHASNVSNISVSCEPAAVAFLSYNIGVTVSGLAEGASVTLINNGKDSLKVSENGLFVFPNAYALEVAGENTYNVTVSTNPAGQTCSLSNATGANTGTHFSNFVNVTATCN
ncbi:hypothetical protein [Noviherbaspirillum sp.]|jgi:sugar lactone lactonase YvrE|uniref:hypothetical protein n=1 Tax=Noviherbaspirillum sp. TaxID=1926288 RepID=UPI0025F963C0|nr:hypothetical protein [Noviherbaspirillum sp.]